MPIYDYIPCPKPTILLTPAEFAAEVDAARVARELEQAARAKAAEEARADADVVEQAEADQAGASVELEPVHSEVPALPVAPAEAGAYPDSPDRREPGVDEVAVDGPLPSQGRRAGGGAGPAAPAGYRNFAWTPARKVRFLDGLAAHGNVRLACKQVGISPEGAYRLRRRDGVFAEAWAAALVLARVEVQQVLADRALHGVEEDVWFRGELVGKRRRYDSRLLLAHLARLDRLADETVAGARAGRFDELLALVAGETYPDHMTDRPNGLRYEPDPLLPMERGRYIVAMEDRAAQEAHWDALELLMDAAVERGDADPAWRGETVPERVLSPEEMGALGAAADDAAEQGRETAEATYDAWLDCSGTCVERAEHTPGDNAPGEEPAYEVKSLDGIAPHLAGWWREGAAVGAGVASHRGTPGRTCPPLTAPAGRMGTGSMRHSEVGRVFSQDTVNSVNLPGFARRGGVPLGGDRGAAH